MLKLLKLIVFGRPIKGETLPEPTLHTVMPDGNRISFNEWAKHVAL